MTDSTKAQSAGTEPEGTLTFQGRTWAVESPPVVVDTEGGAQLVEIWVRGEDIEQSQ
ncbi:hypothetical protein ACE1SV_12680 [Streptomyces sennicomposti]